MAVPLTLALLMVVLASHPGAGRIGASAMQPGDALEDGGTFATASQAMEFAAVPGIRGVLDARSTLERKGNMLTLRAGTAIVRTSGFVRMQVGESIVVDGVRTGWYALSDSANTVVVALAAPIAVTARGELTVLTVGEQIRVPSAPDQAVQRTTVPQGWLQGYIGRIAALSEEPVDLQAAIADTSPLHVLRDAMLAKQYDTARAFVEDAGNEPALVADANHPAVAAVVALLGQTPNADADAIAVALQCVRALEPEAPLDRLLSIAYGIGRVPGANADAETILADAFPVGEDAARWAGLLTVIERSSSLPLPDAFVTRWQRLVERAATADPSVAVTLLSDATGLPMLIEDRGYPRHARIWEDVLREATAYVNPLLSAGDRVQLEKALHDAAARALPKAEAPAVASSSAPAVSTHSREELIAMTKQAISEHGAMLTPTTSFVIPDNQADAVRVLGVYFATRKGDLPFEFTYHPVTETLDRIVVSGQLLPNTLTLQQFLSGL